MMQVTVVGGDIIMLIASGTTAKWKATKEVHSLASPHLHECTHARTRSLTHSLTHARQAIAETVTSFYAVETPKTSLKRSSIESGVGNKEALGVDGYDLLRYDSPIWRT